MALHLIPDDDSLPHAPSTECGCGPVLVDFVDERGARRPAFLHLSPCAEEEPDDAER